MIFPDWVESLFRSYKESLSEKSIFDSAILPACFLIGAALIVVYDLLIPQAHQQFIFLAQAFLHGKLYLLPGTKNLYDSSMYQGHYYWPLGPIPAVLLMPVVFFFGTHFLQGYVELLLNLLNCLLLFLIAKKITNNLVTARWLSFGYIFSSAYIYIATFASSWFYAQVVATTLTLALLYEFLTKRRYLVMGILIGLSVATRLDLVFSTLFVLWIIVRDKSRIFQKIQQLIPLLVSLGILLVLLLFYNFLRFHNFFEQGYRYQQLHDQPLIANRAAGLWSFVHFPANIYYLFIQGLEPIFQSGTKILKFPYITYNPWGLSIFITSPIFFWMIKAPFKDKVVQASLIASVAILFILLGYYGIGYYQYGYRYAMDLYPFLYIILAYGVRKRLPSLFKWVVVLSFFLNLYLLPGILTELD